jgi:hypothetical protein
MVPVVSCAAAGRPTNKETHAMMATIDSVFTPESSLLCTA